MSLPKSDPNAPGPTALQDLERVAGLMRLAGLKDIEAQPYALESGTPNNGMIGPTSTALISLCHPAPERHRAYFMQTPFQAKS